MPDEKIAANAEDQDSIDDSSEGQAAGARSGRHLSARTRKALIMFLVLALQAALAYAVAQFLILPRLPGSAAAADSLALSEEAAPVEETERGSIIMMDDVVVNLKDADGGMRFLKVTAGLEFKESKLETEIAARMPELRDLLIDHLSSHEVADVVHRDGREVVKRQLLEDFNRRLQQGQLINVYFSDFVVQ